MQRGILLVGMYGFPKKLRFYHNQNSTLPCVDFPKFPPTQRPTNGGKCVRIF